MPEPIGKINVKFPEKPERFKYENSNTFSFPPLPMVKPDKVKMDTPLELVGKTVMVNPGHGEFAIDKRTRRQMYDEFGNKRVAKGACYPLDGKLIEERNLNDSVAIQVKKGLEARGAKVIYVDNTNINLVNKLENQYKPDFFVAIHHNSTPDADPKASGEVVLSNDKRSPISAVAAECINNWFKADPTIPQNPIDYTKKEALYAVLRVNPEIPAVITEAGMMCNPDELRIINKPEYQKKTAGWIVEGIVDFFRINKKNKTQGKK